MTRTRPYNAIFAGGYAIAAIITFGHCAAHTQCRSPVTRQVIPCESAEQGGAAVFAAMLWPLYWSWEAFS